MQTVIHTNQTEKGQSCTVKLINSENSNQKKLRIDISINNNKGDNPMKISNWTINKQDKPFLGTVVSTYLDLIVKINFQLDLSR